MSMNQVAMFEIHASDLERAAHFYAQAFGWHFEAIAADFYRLTSHNLVHGSIFRRRGPEPTEGQPVNAWVCTLQVGSVDAALTAIQAAGGRVAVPKFAVAGVGWSAYFKDTEGNIAGVFQHDSAAK
jgi:uncharacterized protein